LIFGNFEGKVPRHAQIGFRHTLEKAGEAYARMMSGDANFRVVLTM